MSDTCTICVKAVLDSEEGIECDGRCKRWFHRECAKVTKSEYLRIAGNPSNKWYCSRTDSIEQDKNPQAHASNQLSSVIGKLDELLIKVNKIDGISKDIAAIKSEIASINSQVSALEPRVSDVEAKLIDISSGVVS